MAGFFGNNKKKKDDYIDTLSTLGKATNITDNDFLSRVDTKIDPLTINNGTSSTSSTLGVDSTTKTSSDLESFLGNKKNKNLSQGKDKLEWAINLKTFPLSIITGVFFVGSLSSFLSHENIRSEHVKQDAYLSKVEKSVEIIGKQSLLMRSTGTPISPLESLEAERVNIAKILGILEFGGTVDGTLALKALTGESLLQVQQLKKDWEVTESTIDELIKQKSSIINSKNFIIYLKQQSTPIANSTQKLQKILLAKDPSGLGSAAVITTSVYKVLNDITGTESSTLTEEKKNLLADDLANISSSLNNLKAKYADSKEISDVIQEYEKSIEIFLNKNKVLENIAYLNKSNELISRIFLQTKKINDSMEPIHEYMSSSKYNNNYLVLASIALSALGTLTLLLISISLYAKSVKTLRLANGFKRNQSNEKALNELLSQIEPLDEGNFTKPIFIEDKFLMNLAKRIDNTRVLFGEIVRQMKNSSGNILNSADSTEKTSQQLLEISNRQFQKLAEAINNINEITNSIDEIAQSTWIAQDEANSSVQESEKGEKLVGQSIEKMNEIRHTIQESSKKIKKLGESAQSITEVTSLIKDITKQINILALNAAIQAASSGESGREFTVVAQEVQRLADDSEAATKKIEELINEIQSDTAVAIASMERTTQEVVNGAQLTEQAGISLKAINDLSKNTAEQFKAASSKLEEKSTEMAAVTFEMQNLQMISQEAQKAVNTTTAQVESLKKISEDLEDTFKQYKV
jgi:twitching motility protein PilJ